MAEITTIFSDLGNVVVFYDNMRAVDALMKESELYTANRHVVHDLLFGTPYGLAWRYAAGDMTSNDFRFWVSNLLRLRADLFTSEFDEAFSDIYTMNQPVVDLWKLVRGRGIRMVALSDVEEIRFLKQQQLGVMDPFEDGVYSYQEKALKRDGPLLFERALQIAGCVPSDALFVDDLGANIEEARKLGIRTHLYDYRDHKALENELILLGVSL